ncbi:MAG: SAM-dependent methyltransferase, partial [Myxococcota bacterium]
PAAWQGRFELVFECRNLQALPLSVRSQAVDALATTVAPQGRLLVITRLRPDSVSDPAGPPWPLSNQELARLEQAGLREQRRQVSTEAGIEQALIEYVR